MEAGEKNYEKAVGEFRELTPEKWWAASIKINLSDEDFEQAIKRAVQEEKFTYSGYRIKHAEGGFEYHFGRYPRRAFGPVVSIERHKSALKKLAETTGGQASEKTVSPDKPRFRILLGLVEGYEREKPIMHSIKEVRQEVGDNFDLQEAEIFSAGPWGKEQWGKYTEPAAVIEGDLSQLSKVCALAEKFHQERIAVDNLQKGKSYMVETKWCKKPDKE